MLHVAILVMLYGWYDVFSPPMPDAVMSIALVRKGTELDPSKLPRKPTTSTEAERAPITEEKAAPDLAPTAKAPEEKPQLHNTKAKPTLAKVEKKEVRSATSPLDLLKKRLEKIDNGQKDGSEVGQVLKGDLANGYLQHVQELIQENFLLPSTLSEPERRRLKALVFLRIRANGLPYDVRIQKTSGNLKYDNAILARIKAISSLGPPPLPLVTRYANEGVTLEMCPIACEGN